MNDGNVGAQMLRMLVKLVIFILKLLPSLIKFIYRSIVGIINMFRKKEGETSIEAAE